MLVIQLHLNESLFLKDPQSTALGKKIIEKSIVMIDKLGFEAFTFKKLSLEIESTEASVYRYFENKHRLLNYLITWYWAWMEYRIEFDTHNLEDPYEKLDIALRIISEKKLPDNNFPNINESALQRIVISEADKTYLTKKVDQDNKEGIFYQYKSLCRTIGSIIAKINGEFPFPHALASTVLEAANQQIYFASHLPSLTELDQKKEDPFSTNYKFLKTMVFNTISVK